MDALTSRVTLTAGEAAGIARVIQSESSGDDVQIWRSARYSAAVAIDSQGWYYTRVLYADGEVMVELEPGFLMVGE